jgi:hypothetical protein
VGSYGASRLWNVERLQDGSYSETSVREEIVLRRVAISEWWWTIYNILVSQLDKIVSPTQERTFSLYGGKHLSEVMKKH